MKRILAMTLCIALLLAAAACGTGESPAGPAAPAASPGASSPAQSKPVPTEEPGRAEPAAPVLELARAVYPEMAPYPEEMQGEENAWQAWRDGLSAQRDQAGNWAEGLEPWLKACLTEFLSGEENRIIAPMNLYMALAMLAELTEGESRAQLLDLLGEEDMDTLRNRAKALWNASYRDDGIVTRRLAASLWLNERIGFVRETMDRLAETYYASSFRGTMGSPEYDRALQDWLNEQTGDLLKEQASQVHMDPDTVLALAATIYFKAAWHSKFSRDATLPMTFHAVDGDRETPFLRKSFTGRWYWGEGFSAVPLELEDGVMWFILPEEGKTPEDLLSGEALAFLLERDRLGWEQSKALTIHFSVPRFDLAAETELVPGLRHLGVRDIFDPQVSDFTPMTGDVEQICVSRATHAARVTIDEDGCTGAAFTVIMPMSAAAVFPRDEVEFTLDRPFLFLVTDTQGLPQFAGAVNTVN